MNRDRNPVLANRSTARAPSANGISLGLAGALLVVTLASCTKPAAPAAQAGTQLPAIRYEAHVSAGGIAPSGGTVSNPHKGDAQSAKAGEGLFASMNCDGCHGGGGTGWVGPSLVDGRWRYGGADQEIFYSIFFGRPKGMPAYGGVLGSEGIWMLVSYLQSASPPATVPTQSWEGPPETGSAAPPATASPETPAPAATVEGLFAQYGCIACHAVDKKVVGPAFQEVAAKYRGQSGAAAALHTKVSNGGIGVWGQIPMPPNSAVPDAQLTKMIDWILALK